MRNNVIDLSKYNKTSDVKKIVCGENHCIILFKDNKIAGFGSNADGQLGMKVDKRETNYISELTIHANNILFDDVNNLDIGVFYQNIDILSKQFSIYLIFLVNENEDTNKILEKLTPLFDDNILLKHVKYSIIELESIV
jgi:hypothetical protein